MPPDRQLWGRNGRGMCRGTGNRGWFICIEMIQEGSERFINSPRHHRRRQSDNRNGEQDVMLKQGEERVFIKFWWRVCLHLELMTKETEWWKEGSLGGIQISLCLPASDSNHPGRQNSSKWDPFLCRIRKGFRGIVSNQDFFFKL